MRAADASNWAALEEHAPGTRRYRPDDSPMIDIRKGGHIQIRPRMIEERLLEELDHSV